MLKQWNNLTHTQMVQLIKFFRKISVTYRKIGGLFFKFPEYMYKY